MVKIKYSSIQHNIVKDVYVEYEKVYSLYQEFLSSKQENICVSEILDRVKYFNIRISKLVLMLEHKLYKTYNVNKKTNIRYIVYRMFWIDEDNKPFRHFSKNLGNENKVTINKEIPNNLLNNVTEQLLQIMKETYNLEYGEIFK